MHFDVKQERSRWIGGSDLPAILNISPFKTRWQLLLEKAGLAESDFDGNRFTAYGNELEPKIRDFVNQKYNTEFIPDRKYVDDCRFHCDGNNGEAILEIKTTSHIEDDVHGYKAYLTQLLAYTEAWGYSKAILAVYHRPEDFSTDFDESRLYLYEIDIKGYEIFLERLHNELDRFRFDLARLKENPLLTEEDFLPTAVIEAANKVAVLECRMAEYKAIEAEYKAMKQSLFEAMEKHDIRSWETFNGTKITRVDGTEASTKTVTEFDAEAFAESHPRLYKKFTKEVEKKTAGKSGFVRITLPKGQ